MQDILTLLKSHRSVRKYKPDPISDELLDNILDAARQAPTSSNVQAYSIIVIKDREKKKELARLCGDQSYVESCPVFLALCPDLHRLELICETRNYAINDRYIENFIVAVADTALVAENILVAAEGSGLGVCMIGAIRNNPDNVCGLLKLPSKVFPLMGMCLGYPDHEPMIKPRLPNKLAIHREEYSDDNFSKLLREYDSLVKASGLYDGPGRQVKSPDGREVPEDDYSWSEHTSRRMASINPKALRTHLKSFLLSRGFKFD